ncbi:MULTISPECIES: hypothetical protein [Flavobacteriaceae]|uniref:Uncharacterized protein n=2 Tax=Flavobacteriaceae TaxID=49546 RepID=A0A1L7I970_9FLAO|nr:MULTISPECIES: hypothetical protein [Flavobacteriaceae]APU70146.1 hypothetical protein GRFL_3422 [Christiangramia flava JLT2011]MDT0642559.1 hypothetical protein [Zunongwangia sp. F363]OSS39633.1 hypothetical protein C723_1535 [Christiangramia flava JLT2011]
MEDLFKDYQERLNQLDENIRVAAVKYAVGFYSNKNCSKEEALERGITKAEMHNRKI